ncbi:hypothetical protein DQ04_10661030 [Trypanosoma grayi]|uniref:hypothetical protein n=1 Tax=Trypanosoma grayi TaxID=71804 RepID=UPI0004F426E6|nr:hypothetical protein DQ04_10661030 [Trypanosoma grayi]KEG07172.1 hypothetical protein DQ04_10661030 [Trypanosoma grayi]
MIGISFCSDGNRIRTLPLPESPESGVIAARTGDDAMHAFFASRSRSVIDKRRRSRSMISRAARTLDGWRRVSPDRVALLARLALKLYPFGETTGGRSRCRDAASIRSCDGAGSGGAPKFLLPLLAQQPLSPVPLML